MYPHQFVVESFLSPQFRYISINCFVLNIIWERKLRPHLEKNSKICLKLKNEVQIIF